MMNKKHKIYVAGHLGLVGSAIFKELKARGFSPFGLTRQELDLTDQTKVERLFQSESIDYVFVAAGKVGGIKANIAYPGDFLYTNAMIALNLIESAATYGVKKLVYLGSSCIYPKKSHVPIDEDQLLTGPLEPSNEGYAVAKIMGVKLCEFYRYQYDKNFISVMPCNLYGHNDNYDYETSHVIPGMLRKFHDAEKENKETVTLWGTGTPKREFMHADTAADGIIYAMQHYNDSTPINLGTGHEITIRELAETIKDVVGYKGTITFNAAVPDGTMRKVLNVNKMKELGWNPKPIPLKEGLAGVYAKRFT